MGKSTRSWALCAATAAAINAAAAGCNDSDNTEICVGPACPQYDGVGGARNFFRSAEPNTDTAASAGSADNAGSAGSSGSADNAGASGDSGDLPDAGSVDTPDDRTPDATTPDPTPDATPPAPPCEIAFTAPVTGDAGDLTLDGANDTDGDACGPQFTVSVGLTSSAQTVTLFINEAPLGTQDVVDGAVSFDAILGNRGTTPNVLRAEATMADSSTCSLTFPNDILVDCPGPSCSIQSPVANAGGYLNATQDSDGASGLTTDIVVGTELANQDQQVRLEIDGVFETVPAATVIDDSGNGSATFTNVTLAEGPRSVRAECSDAFGVTTLSPAAAFNVDVTPCSITLSGIAGGANPITPADDLTPGVNGIQVLATGQITGGDCKTLWIGVCGGGLAPLPLTLPPDGSFSLPVTLTGSTGALDICGSVEDLAGNLGTPDQLTVHLRFEPPQVALVSPAPSTHYNLLGTSGATADSNALSSSCEAAVVANCTEVGQNVDLLADGSLIAQATCVAQVGLVSPFLGQATFAQASIPTKNDGSSTALTAQQTATGFATAVSASVSVQADCEAPTCNLVSPNSSLAFLNLALDSDIAAGFQINVDVQSDANSFGQSVGLLIDGTDSGLSVPLAVQGGGTLATFVSVPLGQGPRTAQARCIDAAGNTQTSATSSWTVDSVPCSASGIVVAGGANPITPASDSDGITPDMQVTANGQATGGDCTIARVEQCGSAPGSFVPLALDQSFSALPLTLTSVTGSANVCVEVEDAAGNVGQAQTSVPVRVDPPVVALIAPSDGTRFNIVTACLTNVVATCSEVGIPVQLFVDGSLIDAQPCTGTNDVTFSAVALATKNDGTFTSLSVLQTANGLSSIASSINVQADCQTPAPSITAPGCGTRLDLPEDDLDLISGGLQADVDVANDGAPDVTLTITRGGSPTNAQASGAVGSPTTTFSSLDLGGPGSIAMVACVTDAAGNPGCSASCALTIAAHPTLAITSPLNSATLSSTTSDCSGTAGVDVTVTGISNALAGSAVQLRIGNGAIANPTVSGGGFSACVAAPEGMNQTLAVTVTDSSTGLVSSASIQVNVDSITPTSPIAAPTFFVTGRREGTARLTWSAVNDTDGSTLSSYLLRCAKSNITNEATWSTATAIPVSTLPSAAGGPAHNEVFGGFRTGTTKFCVLRGVDKGGQLTPIAAGQSVTVSNPFLTRQYNSVTTATTSRVAVAPLGDINGDGQNDFIVGSENNGAQIYFGGSGLDTTPDILINGPAAGRFGSVVYGLGDINGDGIPDFALAASTMANGALASAGAVYVYFGRATWSPLPFTFTAAAIPGCGADICIQGTQGFGGLGAAVMSSDFNGDGQLDLVIGAQGQNNGPAGQNNTSNLVGQVYVLLGGSRLQKPTGTIIQLPGDNPDGFLIRPTGTDRFFGNSLTPAGNGSGALDGLVIGARGRGVTSTNGGVFFKAGEPYLGPSGLLAPSGGALTEFASGSPSDFATPVSGIGDFNGDGFGDVCVSHDLVPAAVGGSCAVYLGQAGGFAPAGTVLQYTNDLPDNDWANYSAIGVHNSSSRLLGDLDGDGLGDLAIGSVFVAGRLGTVGLFYGDVGVTARPRSKADATFTTVDQGNLSPSFVGDIDGDAFMDLAIFDTDVTVGAGTASRVTLLY